MTTVERFFSKVDMTGACWQWTGSLAGKGYGKFSHHGGRTASHRFVYELQTGETIPAGLAIDHLCRNHGCVNPDHLEAVTQKINILRGTGTAAVNARKTHCHAGHLFDAQNTYVHLRGRACRQCHSEAMRAYRVRKKETTH